MSYRPLVIRLVLCASLTVLVGCPSTEDGGFPDLPETSATDGEDDSLRDIPTDDGDATEGDTEDGSTDADDETDLVEDGDAVEGDSEDGAEDQVEEVFEFEFGRCRLQGPAELTVVSTDNFGFQGRVLAPGLTDLTTGIDANSDLVAQGGYGASGSEPAGNDEWVWVSARSNGSWTDTDDPGFDEYRVNIEAPDEQGDYIYAFRFSEDGGDVWHYCDLDTGEDGEDGSEDGFDVENAGVLTVLPHPCNPNPCAASEPRCDVDDLTRLTPQLPGACLRVENEAECTFVFDRLDCSLVLGTCSEGSCVGGAEAPGEGQIIISEFMARSGSTGTDRGEWIEIWNPQPNEGLAFNLQGCVLRDDSRDNHDIEDILLVRPGERLVMARSDDADENHGLPVDYVYSNFSLSNSGDEIVLQCGETVVHQVLYENDDLIGAGVSAQLDLNSEELGLSGYCLTPEENTYGTAEKVGTPGSENVACPIALVDRCRLLEPYSIETREALAGTVQSEVLVAGRTDSTTGLDDMAELVAEVGYGPSDADPSADDSDWTWFAGVGSDDTDDETDDLYNFDFEAPEPGSYAFATRFTLDSGRHWTYCDRDTGEDGEDGSENGFALADAGTLTVLANPCLPNPCGEEVSANFCDSSTYVEPTGVEQCVVVEGDAPEDVTTRCDLPATRTDCSATLATCGDSGCEGGAVMPGVGDLYVSEFLVLSGLGSPDNGEWFELFNPSDGDEPGFNLEGCIVSDEGSDDFDIDDILLVRPGESVVLARSDVAEDNAALPEPDWVYGGQFLLANTEDEIILTCAGNVAASVAYVDESRIATGRSTQLDPAEAPSGDMSGYCISSGSTYGDGLVGTPGEANPSCSAAPDLCRLVLDEREQYRVVGETVTIVGEVYVAGATGDGHHPGVTVQAGHGATDVVTDWTWVDSTFDGNTSDDAEGGRYTHTLTTDEANTFLFAVRVSLNEGSDWTYCDMNRGEGQDGSQNGFANGDAGLLTVQADPCDSFTCPEGEPVCDGDTLIEVGGEATCSPAFDDGDSIFVAECSYADESTTNCVALGGTCDTDECVGIALPPVADDIIITEAMYDPEPPLSEGNAEWFEITNRGDVRRSLAGCVVRDASEQSVEIDELVMEPDAVVLFARSDDTGLNGGLDPDFTFGFPLNNTGRDTLELKCGEDRIDFVDIGGAGYPLGGINHSIALDGRDYDEDYAGTDWCEGYVPYFLSETGHDHYGTPGELNPSCEVDHCHLVGPTDETVDEGDGVSASAQLQQDGFTDLTTGVEASDRVAAQIGFGPAAVDPASDTEGRWEWQDAAASDGWNDATSDQHEASLDPGLGDHDIAARYRVTSGDDWTYCDLAPGNDNGYHSDNAGKVTVLGNPCEVENVCPASVACDGTELVERTGECSVVDVDGTPTADCEETRVDCATTGGTCGSDRWCQGETDPPETLVFSEYLEGSSLNKVLEITNTSVDTPVDLSECQVLVFKGGNTTEDIDIELTGSLAAEEQYTICHSSFAHADACDQTLGLDFNGDDAVTLVCGSRVVDSIGRLGEDPGSAWGSGDVRTIDDTLLRTCPMVADRVPDDSFDPADTWTGYSRDHFGDVGMQICSPEAVCEIDFDNEEGTACMDANPCGAAFSGGGRCHLAGAGNCYDTGSRAWEVPTGNTTEVDLGDSADVVAVELMLSSAGGTATLQLLDGSRALVATVDSTENCESGPMPDRILVPLSPHVRYLTLEASGSNAWMDTLRIYRSGE